MSSASELLPSRRSDRVLAIHDERHAAVRRAPTCTYPTERVPEITVSACHGQGAAREEHARPPNQPLLNGSRDTRITAPDISHRGETAVEGVAQHLGGIAGNVGQRLRLYIGYLEAGAQNVTVCVDQSGHQGLAADIDHVPANRLARRSVHRHDTIALDDHDRLVEVLALHTVENPRVQECRSIHRSPVGSAKKPRECEAASEAVQGVSHAAYALHCATSCIMILTGVNLGN